MLILLDDAMHILASVYLIMIFSCSPVGGGGSSLSLSLFLSPSCFFFSFYPSSKQTNDGGAPR